MPDNLLLTDLANAISALQSVFTAYELGDVLGIRVDRQAHARLGSLRLSNIVELDRPRLESDPEIHGVPFQKAPF
jgi:hypothetical protein